MSDADGLALAVKSAASPHVWPGGLLSEGDPAPVLHLNAGAPSPFLLVCDHGGNAVPQRLPLGVPPDDLNRHIGYDIGILAVAERLAQALGAELIAQRYSRLVIDCNRPPHAVDAMPARIDGSDVPANVSIAPRQAAARVAEIFCPYHHTIAATLDRKEQRGERTILVALHSFTRHHTDYPGPRPWPIALLFRRQPALAHALSDLLAAEDLLVGMNEPYAVDDLSDYTAPVHAEERALTSALIEIRQDGIADPDGQAAWAERLARVLPRAAERVAGVLPAAREAP